MQHRRDGGLPQTGPLMPPRLAELWIEYQLEQRTLAMWTSRLMDSDRDIEAIQGRRESLEKLEAIQAQISAYTQRGASNGTGNANQ